MQKRASRYLKIGGEQTMQAAETLYQQGIISYPRTETEKFKAEFDLQAAIGEFRGSTTWGDYATGLLDRGKFQYPRSGANDDNAHPPITPMKSIDPASIADPVQRGIYELVVKHFLACCSQDGKGQQTVVTLKVGTETFTAKGLMIMERVSRRASEVRAKKVSAKALVTTKTM